MFLLCIERILRRISTLLPFEDALVVYPVFELVHAFNLFICKAFDFLLVFLFILLGFGALFPTLRRLRGKSSLVQILAGFLLRCLIVLSYWLPPNGLQLLNMVVNNIVDQVLFGELPAVEAAALGIAVSSEIHMFL